jgi:hypothetical protein
VIVIGVLGSVLGRSILLLYAPLMANRYLKASKTEDIKFLGDKMNQNKWKGIVMVLAYSLLPLPTTFLFLGGGISKIKPLYVIAPFLVGKFTSDSIALHLRKFASENQQSIIDTIFLCSLLLVFFWGLRCYFVCFHQLAQLNSP